jgi:amino acid adenylation domain-containing protein
MAVYGFYCICMNDLSKASPPWHPLSSVQAEIWFGHALYPDAPVYNITAYHRIPGVLDRTIFQQAITLLVQETDALRMALSEKDGVPFQSFPEMPAVATQYRDVSKANDPMQTALLEINEAANQPFRIFEEPLFRFTLYKLSEELHLWLQTYHHLIMDGASGGLLVQRLAALYNALLRGVSPPVRQSVSYLEFVASDLAYLSSDSFVRHRQYWLSKYSSLPEPLLSPKVEFAKHAKFISSGAHTWFLPRPRYAQLEALAQAHSVSVFHALLGLFYVVFTRLQDRDECVIGLPVLNRNTQAFKHTIGLFVSVMPARFSHGKETSFIGLMQAIAKTLRENYRYQRFPVSELNRQAGVIQGGRKRLYDLSLSFIKQDYTAHFGSNSGSGNTLVIHRAEQLPLAIYVGEYSEQQDIQIDFSYNLAYFDAEEIRTLQRRFMRLLEDALERPESSISELEILAPEERETLLDKWSGRAGAARFAPTKACVHELFEAQVSRSPDAVALVFEDEALSYAELNARANQLAHALIARGVGREVLVAIALERSPAMIVAVLATLKAGGAYVPLDPAHPTERLAFMLEDSGARAMLIGKASLAQLPGTAKHILCLDTEQADIAELPDTNPRSPVAPDQLAYVIYTSGSTGKPKGVAVEHRSIVHHCVVVIDHFELSHKDRVLQFASLSFDPSVEQILPTLCSGGTVVLPEHGLRSPVALDQVLRRQRVTVANLPPAFFEQWMLQTGFCLKDTALRLLLVGGDAFACHLLSIWRGALQPGQAKIRLLNAYGPTEATVTTTCFDIPEAFSGPTVSIGRPLPQRTIYVLDRHLQPTPIGVPGELHIGGACLARGYLNRPELTAERFIPDPFSGEPGARLYKTGDLVRYLPDGNIEFLGRLDHQVKVRGFRVELGEIEAALVANPLIREAVVIARKDESGDQRLIAYLVASSVNAPATVEGEQTLPSMGALRSFLKATLPEYMLPAAFVWLPALPLSPNGKVDRKALSELETTPLTTDGIITTGDDLEEMLMSFWRTALHLPLVGLHDNFFTLGGHSLLAVKLASRVGHTLGIEVPFFWLFDAPTITELAALIRPVLAQRSPKSGSPADFKA